MDSHRDAEVIDNNTSKKGEEETLPRGKASIATFESVAAASGSEAVARQLLARFPDSALVFDLIKPEHGIAHTRTHVDEGVNYWSYSAPAIWRPRHSVLLAHIVDPRPDWFVHHRGEELLCAIEGGPRVAFYYAASSGGKPSDIETPPLAPMSVLRLNPSVPHMVFTENPATGPARDAPPDKPAEIDRKVGSLCWVVFRNPNSASISIERKLLKKPKSTPKVSKDALNQPGHYGLVAWGIANELRAAREDARLSITEVATFCNITASHLSRIENGSANVSFETLEKLAKLLHVDLPRTVKENAWCYFSSREDPTSVPRHQTWLSPKPPTAHHELHPAIWTIKPGDVEGVQHELTTMGQGQPAPNASGQAELAPDASPDTPATEGETVRGEEIMTWIVLQGRLLVRFKVGDSYPEDLLTPGAVLHLRNLAVESVVSIDGDAKVLVIDCVRPGCRCPGDASRVPHEVEVEVVI